MGLPRRRSIGRIRGNAEISHSGRVTLEGTGGQNSTWMDAEGDDVRIREYGTR